MQNKLIEKINSTPQVDEQKKIIGDAVSIESIELKALFLASSNEIKGLILAEIIAQGKNTFLDSLWGSKTPGIDQSVKDEALKVALLKGARITIDALIKKGADPNLVGTIKNPLMDALEKGDLASARTILDGKNSIIIEELEVAITHNRFALLGGMLAKASSYTSTMAMNFATKHGKTTALNIILDSNPSQDTKNGALSYAISIYRNSQISLPNKLEAIEILISAGAIPSEKDLFDNSIYSQVDSKGLEMEVAELVLPHLKSLSPNNALKLLKNETLLNKIWDKLDVNVQKAIQEAAERAMVIEDKDSLIKAINNPNKLNSLLSQGADPNRLGSNGKTALMTAIEQGNLAAVERLLLSSSLIIKDKEGNSLAHYLNSAQEDVKKAVDSYMTKNLFKIVGSESGRDELILLLLAGVNPNQLGPDGTTPLMEAVKNGNIAIVKELLDRGADPKMKDQNGNGLEYYIEPIIMRVEQQLSKNEAPKQTDLGVLKLIAPHIDKITPEMAKRITSIQPVRLAFKNAKTTLSVGVSLEIAWSAAILFADGPNSAHPDILMSNIDNTPKLVAFLSAGADPNRLGTNGNTALTEAVKTGRVEAAQELMMHGADIHVKNQDGKTASDYIIPDSKMHKLFKAYEAMEKQFKEKFENQVLESVGKLDNNYTTEDLAKLFDDTLKEAYKPGFV